MPEVYTRKSRKNRNAKRKMRKPQDHPRLISKQGISRKTRRQYTKSEIRIQCNGRANRMRKLATREMGH